jgi:hypothetical protein
MVDYAKLIEEEKEKKDSAISLSELQKKKDVELPALFRSVEIALGEELAQANEELKRRGASTITGPFRPFIGEERIELGFGSRNPCCLMTLQSTAAQVGLSRIHVELLDEEGKVIALTDYVIEGDSTALRMYKSLVEGFPDRASEISADEVAREIVPGIIRGRFA